MLIAELFRARFRLIELTTYDAETAENAETLISANSMCSALIVVVV